MKKKSKAASVDNAKSLSRHRSVWEMRADGWIGLVDDLGRLDDDGARPRRTSSPRWRGSRELVDSLAPIESYWAFPGGADVHRTAQLDRARRTGPRPPGGAPHPPHAGRRRPTATTTADARAATATACRRSRPTASAQAQLSRPYFEVLIVDEMTRQRRRRAAPPRAEQAQPRRRLHLRHRRRAELRGRADRHAGQLQPAGGGDPPRLSVALGLSQRHAAPLPRQRRRHASSSCPNRSAARCSASRSRSCGPSSTCTWSPTSTSRRSPRAPARSSSASSSARRTTPSCTARS